MACAGPRSFIIKEVSTPMIWAKVKQQHGRQSNRPLSPSLLSIPNKGGFQIGRAHV